MSIRLCQERCGLPGLKASNAFRWRIESRRAYEDTARPPARPRRDQPAGRVIATGRSRRVIRGAIGITGSRSSRPGRSDRNSRSIARAAFRTSPRRLHRGPAGFVSSGSARSTSRGRTTSPPTARLWGGGGICERQGDQRPGRADPGEGFIEIQAEHTEMRGSAEHQQRHEGPESARGREIQSQERGKHPAAHGCECKCRMGCGAVSDVVAGFDPAAVVPAAAYVEPSRQSCARKVRRARRAKMSAARTRETPPAVRSAHVGKVQGAR